MNNDLIKIQYHICQETSNILGNVIMYKFLNLFGSCNFHLILPMFHKKIKDFYTNELLNKCFCLKFKRNEESTHILLERGYIFWPELNSDIEKLTIEE